MADAVPENMTHAVGGLSKRRYGVPTWDPWRYLLFRNFSSLTHLAIVKRIMDCPSTVESGWARDDVIVDSPSKTGDEHRIGGWGSRFVLPETLAEIWIGVVIVSSQMVVHIVHV